MRRPRPGKSPWAAYWQFRAQPPHHHVAAAVAHAGRGSVLHDVVFVIAVLALCAVTAGFAYVTTTDKGRRARPPKAASDDAEDRKTVAWLRGLHEVPARVMAAPLTRARIALAALGVILDPPWPPARPGDPAVLHAAARALPNPAVIRDERPPVVPPWPVAHIDGQPLPQLPLTEPPLEELPASWQPRACPDVDQPTAILRPGAQPPDWSESDQALCLCGIDPDVPGEPITSEADCPAHGDPPADSTQFGGPPGDDVPDGILSFEGELTSEQFEAWRQAFGGYLAADAVDGQPAGVVLPPDPHEISEEEHEAAVAGLVERHGEVPPSLQRVIDHGGRIGLPVRRAADDTVTDLPAIADAAFVRDTLARPATPKDVLGGLSVDEWVDVAFRTVSHG